MRGTRSWCGFLGLLAVLLSLAQPASAHSGRQSYVYLDILDTSIAGRIEFPLNDINTILKLQIPQEEAASRQGLDIAFPKIRSYAEKHFAIGPQDGNTSWDVEFDRNYELLTQNNGNGNYVIAPFKVKQRFPSVPREFKVTYSGVIADVAGRDALLIIGSDWKSGTLKNERNHLLRYTPDSTTARRPLSGLAYNTSALATTTSCLSWCSCFPRSYYGQPVAVGTRREGSDQACGE
jgi:hypothetical protein